MTIQNVLRAIGVDLVHMETPGLDADLIVAHVLRCTREQLIIDAHKNLTGMQLRQIENLSARRRLGEPIAYLTGEREFYGRTFFITKDVLVPRPDSETLISSVLRAHAKDKNGELLIFDFGSGSGCLGLTLLAEFKKAQLVAIDISPEAIEVGQKNANKLELNLRAQFLCENVAQFTWPSAQLADIIIANPPYLDRNDPDVQVSVKEFEPEQALFAENEGLGAYQKWVPKAFSLGKPGGLVAFEIGCRQGETVRKIFEATERARDIQVVQDLSGKDRVVIAWIK